MFNKLLLLTALVGCADLDTESDEGSLGATETQPAPIDPCSTTDQPVFMPRIRAVKWSWQGCGPSTTDPAYSLTTTNAAATAYTLKVMTWVAVVFTPIVLGYQAWTYWVFRKRIAVHHIPTPVLADAAQ